MTSPAELRATALQVAKGLEPHTMTGEQAARAVRELAVAEKACATARMFMALRVAQTDAWRGQGHQSAADWLAAETGISVGAAASQLSTAKKADRLPKTKEAMRKGDLSPDQAGAVADAATADPEAEDDLLGRAARDTTANLKKEAAKRKAAATDSATRERRIRSQRSLRRYTDGDGALHLHLRGPAIDGVRLDAMLRPFEEQAFRSGRSDGLRDTFENRSYDAFYAMLAHLRAGAEAPATPIPVSANPGTPAGSEERPGASSPTNSVDPTDARDPSDAGDPRDARDPSDAVGGGDANRGRSSGDTAAGRPGAAPSPPWAGDREARAADPPPHPSPPRPPGGNNVKVIVLIDHTALVRGHTLSGETCEVAGLGPIPVSAARELMHDAFLAAVIKKGRDVINVAHLGRGLNAHQRTAVEALGLRCTNIACNRTIAIQIDHRHPYVANPETKLDNQDPFCPECHRKKTHWGWHLEEGTGPRRFLPPDAPDRARPPGAASRAPAPSTSASTSTPTARRPESVEQPALC